jgi:hypothetical protein
LVSVVALVVVGIIKSQTPENNIEHRLERLESSIESRPAVIQQESSFQNNNNVGNSSSAESNGGVLAGATLAGVLLALAFL